MIGKNKLEMNQATMNHAMQLYVDHIFEGMPTKVKVTDVEKAVDTFIVTMETIPYPETTEEMACL